MAWVVKKEEYIPPVQCPKCGEKQNRFNGHVNLKENEIKHIDCMVCGRIFEKEEYEKLVSAARSHLA